MNGRAEQIGFSQRVRLEWLERTANLVLAGNDKATVNSSLKEYLKDKVSIGGEAERGNREKIITILMKVWLNVPPELEIVRVNGLELLQRLPQKERLTIHWGMVTAVYPFWGAVARNVGRLLNLQGSVAAIQVQRRVRELYGQRETVSRAARRVLRSYVDWGVLTDEGSKGIYYQGESLIVEDTETLSWLIEASLHAQPSRSARLKEIVESASLFPFRLAHKSAETMLAGSQRLELLRHGLDDDWVSLPSHTPPVSTSPNTPLV